MSQPNLSKALKDLEQICGFRIFTRTGAGMMPTRKGEAFLLQARAVLEPLDAMDAIYQGHNRTTAYLSAAIPRASYIAHAVTAFVSAVDAKGGMELNIRETSTAEVVRDVASREMDIGIVRYPLENANKLLGHLNEQGLSYILYWRFQHVVILSREHPLAREKGVHIAQLQPFTEISHGDTAQPVVAEDTAPETLLEPRRLIRIYERGSQFDLLSRCAFTYMWVSPMPQETLERHGLVQLECVDPMPVYQDALIYLKGYAMSRWEQAFYDLVRKETSLVTGQLTQLVKQ